MKLMILMLFFLEQYKTHRGGEGAGRVGMECEDEKLIFTQTGLTHCLGLWDKIKKKTNKQMPSCRVVLSLL